MGNCCCGEYEDSGYDYSYRAHPPQLSRAKKDSEDYVYPENDHELVLTLSVRLERRLEKQYDAKGKGLGEKIKDAESQLPPCAIRPLKSVSRLRNDLARELKIPQRDDFIMHYEAALRCLNM